MTDVDSSSPAANADRADSFSLSVVLLISTMLGQRVIGLARSVFFCGMLGDDELGRWSLVNSYFGWAAPFFILGIPGSFGRLCEYFQARGELRCYLRRMGLLTGTLAVGTFGLHLGCSEWIARVVFNSPSQAWLIPWMGAVLVAVVLFNSLTELLTALRHNRMVSRMQLVQSFGFAVISAISLLSTTLQETGVILAFGAATAGSAVLGTCYLLRIWHSLSGTPQASSSGNMWRQVGRWAWWIWCGNLVINLFDCSDQFLLKHFTGLEAQVADALVGQLFASRVLPILIVSVANLLGGCLLPYLIHDLEAGRRELVHVRMNTVVRYCALGFTAIAAATHILNPVLFTWLLRGKYDHGLHLMPWAFVQYSWYGLILIVGKYLLCVDRPRTGLLPILGGLAVALPLNVLFFSWTGLRGVAVAMTIANGVVLALTVQISQRCGMQWERTTLAALCVPLALCLGGWATCGILLALLIGGYQREWLVRRAEAVYLTDIVGTRLGWTRPQTRGQLG